MKRRDFLKVAAVAATVAVFPALAEAPVVQDDPWDTYAQEGADVTDNYLAGITQELGARINSTGMVYWSDDGGTTWSLGPLAWDIEVSPEAMFTWDVSL